MKGKEQIGKAFADYLALFDVVYHLNGQQTGVVIDICSVPNLRCVSSEDEGGYALELLVGFPCLGDFFG
jgi:hypothetical protein